MKTTLLKNSFLAITLLLTSASVNAQSVLDASVFGFELGSTTTGANGNGPVTGLFIPTASQNILTFSTEQKATGLNSLKLNGASAGAVDYTVQIGNTTSLEASKTNIADGKYDLKAKIYIVSNPPASIAFSVAADATLGNEFKNVVLTIPATTPTNQWVEISALDSTFNLCTKAKITLKFLTGAVAANGATVLYVDDFTLTPSVSNSVKNLSTLDAKVVLNNSNKSIVVNSEQGSDINIYSISGIVVNTIKNIPAIFETSISELNKGLYFVKVSNNGKSFVQKIQVK